MLRIGPEPANGSISAINIRDNEKVVGILKEPTGEYSLDVSGTINCGALLVNGSTLGSGGSGVWDLSDSNTISYTNGNVGIGTTSPNELLSIQSAPATDAAIEVSTQSEANSAIIYLGTPHNSDNTIPRKCAIIAQGTAGHTPALDNAGWSRSDLHFCLEDTDNDDISNADVTHSKMVIKNNGNVGIGTTSPAYELDVSGDIYANNYFLQNNVKIESKEYFGNNITTPSYAWEFRNNTGTSDVPDIINSVVATPSNGATSTSSGMENDGGGSIELDTLNYSLNVSIEFYVSVTSYQEYDRLFNLASGDIILIARLTNTGIIWIYAYDDDNGEKLHTSEATVDSNFKHIVITANTANNISLYVNNVEQSLTTSTTNSNITQYTRNFLLSEVTGNHPVATLSYFRIWNNTILLANQVGSLYNNREVISELNFNIDNETALTISKAYVGIGTDSPQSLFHVRPINNDNYTENLFLDFRADWTSTNNGFLGIYATQAHQPSVGSDLRFKGSYYDSTNPSVPLNTQVMCLKPNGYVGIGTSSPESALHVTGTVGGTLTEGVHLGTPNDTHSSIELVSSDGGNSYIDFSIPGVDYQARIIRNSYHNTLTINNNGGDGWGYLHFLGTNIGINNTNPAYALDVTGYINARGNFGSQFTRIYGRESQGYIAHSNFPDDLKSGNTGYTYQLNYAVYLNSGGNHKFNARTFLQLCINGGAKLSINSLGNVGIGTTSPSYKLHIAGTVGGTSFTSTSDDRLKSNEITITNALTSLMKLNPMTYDKYDNMDKSGNYIRESGLISQDIWYQAPELRHIVSLGNEYNDVSSSTVPIPIDVSNNELLQDADYNNLGWSTTTPSGVKYTYLIAYLIKAVQELNIQRQEEKDALQASHDSLQASHDSLTAKNDALQNELTSLKTILQSKGILD